MGRVKRLLIVVAVLVLLAGGFLVARYLNNDTVERGAVTELLRAQARGDAEAMLLTLDCRNPACETRARALASACARAAT